MLEAESGGWRRRGIRMRQVVLLALAALAACTVSSDPVGGPPPAPISTNAADSVVAPVSEQPTRILSQRDADRLLSEHVQDPGVRAFLLQSLDVKNKEWLLNLDTLAADPQVSALEPTEIITTGMSGCWL